MRRLSWLILILICLMSIASVAVAQDATEEAEPTPTRETADFEVVPAQQEATEPVEATEPAESTEPAEATQEATEDPAETTTTAPTTTDTTTYVVQPGDNLFRIALRFGLSRNELATANNITNQNLIFSGQTLVIPSGDSGTVTPTPVSPTVTASATPTTNPSTPSTYVVQPGDSLLRLAARFNTTITELIQVNNIPNPNLIFIGQTLAIPGGTDTPTDSDDPILDDVDMGTGITVFTDGQDAAALSSQAAQLGVGWVKIIVNWADAEPTEGILALDEIDAAVEAFSNANLNILINIVDAPDWARENATDFALGLNAIGPPDDVADFGTFAGTLAERYTGRVQAYEVWSAPNLRDNWLDPNASTIEITDADGNVSESINAGFASTRYVDLVEAAFTSIKAADADALVVTGGLAPTGLNDFFNAIDTFVFLEAMLDQDVASFADGVGTQVEGFNNPPDATCCGDINSDPQFDESDHFFLLDVVGNYREIMDRNGANDIPIWVTRFGWGTAENSLGTPADGNAYIAENTAAEQAEYIVGAFEAGEELGYVGAMFLYNHNGCPANIEDACFYSLVDASGAARPAFNSIQTSLVANDEGSEAEATEAMVEVTEAPTDVVTDATEEATEAMTDATEEATEEASD